MPKWPLTELLSMKSISDHLLTRSISVRRLPVDGKAVTFCSCKASSSKWAYIASLIISQSRPLCFSGDFMCTCSYVDWLCVQQHFCAVCLSVLVLFPVHHFSAFAFVRPRLSIAIRPVACLSVSSCYSALWTGRHGNLRMPTQTCWTCLHHPRIIKPT